MTPPQRPRILWITDRYPPQPGGMAVSCHRQVTGLRRGGIRIDVLALAGRAEAVRLNRRVCDGGVDYRVTDSGHRGGAAQRAFREVLVEHSTWPYTGVVGFGANYPGYLAATLAAWLEVPSCVLVRGNDFDRDWFDARRAPFVHQALSQAGVIGCVSETAVRRVRALLPSQDVRWTPNGVDVGQWRLLPEDRARRDELRGRLAAEGRRVIGLFGEMKYKKRIPLLLRAIRDAGLRERVSLLIVGRFDAETAAILADEALAPKHLHVKFTDRERLAGCYAACDFIALPSLFEGMPNVLMEAMACGVTPICSSAGAMGDLIEDGRSGFVFKPEDLPGCVEALRRAMSLDDEHLAQMGEAARRFVAENFSCDRERQALAEILVPGACADAGTA